MTNTGKKDAKGRAILVSKAGKEYIILPSGRKSKPAVGRLSRKVLEEKAKQLSAKRVGLEDKAKQLSAKRMGLEDKAKRFSAKRVQLERVADMLDQEAAKRDADDVMKRLNKLVKKKGKDVKSAVQKL
jgi:hypothetical protein